jgi:4a-hydroxytetrahydrobiopterin dehydratase
MPCKGGVRPLGAELGALLKQVDGWNVGAEHQITKNFAFPRFSESPRFREESWGNRRRTGAPPDIYLAWGKVELKIWTHTIDGLTESDFILAAKIDQLARG